ncbi:MAG: ABC transporter ATP-binding protein [Mycobacteriales bacterium]
MLTVENLSTGYGEFQAVHEVSLTVKPGESVALLGLNGAGKSTLLTTIAGLHRVWKGSVEFDGKNVTKQPSHRRLRTGMAFVAESRELFPALTVEENLKAALTTHRLRRAEVSSRVEAATLPFPILRERRGQAAGLLSGGQQQMLAIARALVTQPKLLLLDEPSLGLAPVLVSEIYEQLREMRTLGISMLVVEQHVHEVMGLCDRLYVLELGIVTHQGTPKELTENPEFTSAYVGG